MDFYFTHKKKILIGIGIFICIVVIASILIVMFHSNKEDNSVKYATLELNDGKVSISMLDEVSNQINENSDNSYLIDVNLEEDDMFIYASSIQKLHDIDLYDEVKEDKDSYFQNKENVRNDSEIYESTINNNKAYEYNFVYFDKSYEKDFYCNVIWIEHNDFIYVFNFEISNYNLEKYTDIFSTIKNSITFND